MASRRGLSNKEIQEQLDRLLAEDLQKDAIPGIATDAQSDADDGDTEYEEDSEDEVADTTDLAPAGLLKDTPSVTPRLRLSDLPPRTPQTAGSSRGITGSSAPGWRPDLPSNPSDLRTSPYPSRRSKQRNPPSSFEQHLESLNSPLDIPLDVAPRLRLSDLPPRTPQTTGSDVTTPSPADIAPSSQPRLSSVPKRIRSIPTEGHKNQWTVRRLAAENASKRRREAEAPASGSGSSDDMFPPSPVERPQAFRLRSISRGPTMPDQMDVSDPDDPQPLPPSPTTQNTGRVRFRSLERHPDDESPYEDEDDSDRDPAYHPPADVLSTTSGSDSPAPDSPAAAAARSPSIPPPLANRGRSGRGPGRPPLQHRRRGRGRGDPGQPVSTAPTPAVTPSVPTLAPVAPPGPRRQRPRAPLRDPSILVQKSYKRARGPMREAGDPIRVLQNQTILGSDKVTIWHNTKDVNSPDIAKIENPIPMGHPAQHVKDLSPEDLFSSFLPDEVLQEHVVNPTNRKITELRNHIGDNNIDRASYKDTDVKEIKAVIGCLFLSGVLRDNTKNTTQMFHPIFGTPFYRCVFSQRRFDFLLRCLRFDKFETRNQRKKDDRFFLIRDLWDHVIAKCKENWVAGPIVTVDEQLLGFRGRVLFRMYMPDKPNKYGVKIFMAADGETHYMLFAVPYLGKGSCPDLPPHMNQGHYFTLEVLQHLMQAGRTICLDNWFTSRNLTKELQRHDMHLVGTVKPKPFLPSKAHIERLKLEKDQSVAFFNHSEKINVVYKKVKAKKHVAVMTTVHNKFTYVEETKTEAHMFYNASKGGVDTFDMLCEHSDTGRKTVRWPMCIFYGLTNIVMNNTFIIYSHTAKSEGHKVEKTSFVEDLAYSLCKPFALERLENYGRYFSLELRNLIKTTFAPRPQGAEAVDPAEEPFTGVMRGEIKRKCKFDPKGSTYSGVNLCHGKDCNHQNVCQKHSVLLCKTCYDKVKDHL